MTDKINISQCPHCLCMTKTIGGKCGKCNKVKIMTENIKSEELKNCPFCGGEAEIISHVNCHTIRTIIYCKTFGCTCKIIIGAIHNSRKWTIKEAIKKWNTRSHESLVPISREEITFMVQEIVSVAHIRKESASMIDLVDKYCGKYLKPSDNGTKIEPIDTNNEELKQILIDLRMEKVAVYEVLNFLRERFGTPQSGKELSEQKLHEFLTDWCEIVNVKELAKSIVEAHKKGELYE